jgi:transcriptional regulator with XRE-family HTH domain
MATGDDRDPVAVAFGERARKIREGMRLSLDEMAERCGLSKAGLWQIETAASVCSIATAAKIARGCVVPVGYLIEGEPRILTDRDIAIIAKLGECITIITGDTPVTPRPTRPPAPAP